VLLKEKVNVDMVCANRGIDKKRKLAIRITKISEEKDFNEEGFNIFPISFFQFSLFSHIDCIEDLKL